MSDLGERLRPVTAAEWPDFSRALHDVFGGELPAADRDAPPPVAELDRTLTLEDGGRLVATAGMVSRMLTVPGAVVPCAGVTWVTVSPTHRRQGILTAIMRRQLDELHDQQREPVAALWAAEAPIYGRFGYACASVRGGLSGSVDRLGLRNDVELGDGRVEIVGVEDVRASAGPVHDAVRRWIPGLMERDARWWQRALLDPPDKLESGTARHVLHRQPDGALTGYARYRVKTSWSEAGEPTGTLTIDELFTATPAAHARLWRFLLSHDLVRSLRYPNAPVDEPLRHLLRDPRALHSRPVDALWLRLVDVDRALAARRYPAPLDLVLEVRDRFCPWNEGRWRLSGHPAGAHCGRTDRDPDLVLDVEALAAAYLGGVSLATLQAAGRVTEVSPGAVTLAATSFGWPVTPWCPEEF